MTNSAPSTSEPTPTQRRGMRMAIISQCVGVIAFLTIRSGLVLLYCRELGIPGPRALVYVSLVNLASFVQVFWAPIADRLGYKRVGFIGLVGSAFGYVILTTAAFALGAWVEVLVATGCVVFAVGQAMQASSWFPLLADLVPAERRGRFFGTLRFSWQLTAIAFLTVAAWFLGDNAPAWRYQVVMGVVLIGQAIRAPTYLTIPELRQAREANARLWSGLKTVMGWPRFLPFCAYLFLLTLATSATPMVLTLLQKDGIGLAEGVVVLLGTVPLAGGVLGYVVSGWIIDRYGTKLVFLIGHGAFALIHVGLAAHGMTGLPEAWWFGVLQFGFGFVAGGVGVAATTEMLNLLPPTDRGVATAVGSGMTQGATALAGIFIAWALSVGMLAESWTVWGHARTPYDAVLIVAAASVLVFVITLGLVPSVTGQHQHLPGPH